MRYTIDRKDFNPKQEKCKEEFMFEVWLRGQIKRALSEIEIKQCCKSLERIKNRLSNPRQNTPHF